jgi:hypothetical protein
MQAACTYSPSYAVNIVDEHFHKNVIAPSRSQPLISSTNDLKMDRPLRTKNPFEEAIDTGPEAHRQNLQQQRNDNFMPATTSSPYLQTTTTARMPDAYMPSGLLTISQHQAPPFEYGAFYPEPNARSAVGLDSSAYTRKDLTQASTGYQQSPQTVPSQAMAYTLPGADIGQTGFYNNVSSASPEPSEAASAQPNENRAPHRRGYQACQRCRERKVKCDLGSMSKCITTIL